MISFYKPLTLDVFILLLTDFWRRYWDLVQASSHIEMTIDTGKGILRIERPLFINTKMNAGALAAQQWANAFNMAAVDIGQLLKSFVRRHNIVSPLTGELLCISPRRLRYTLATGLAAEGISKQELARILDHTDTQHVHVYFEMAGNIIEHLDKATAKGFARYLDFFKGKVIKTDEEAINGDREDKRLAFINESDPTDQAEIGICGEASVCHLDPPYSCYLCPKFQPYRHADHEHVLDCLLENREERLEKYESSRLGIQLDQVIAAVAQVVEIFAKEQAHV